MIFFNNQTVHLTSKYDKASLIISRQVIEHIPNLNEFLHSIYQALQDGGGLVLEFPDHSMNYETFDYTFWEEYCNYFTLKTISALLQINGFEIIHHESVLFSGKALLVFARKALSPIDINFSNHSIRDHNLAHRYIHGYQIFRSRLSSYLDEAAKNYSSILIYGAGARSSNFVNLHGIADYIEYFVDDQTEKQNLYVPGCTKRIQPFSSSDKEALFLLGCNCEVENKIIKKRNLKSYASILPPSAKLPKFWNQLICDQVT